LDLSEAVEVLGFVTALCVVGSLSNFFLKEISRTFIRNLPKKYAGFASAYRSFMRFMLRRHRSFGFAALFIVLMHAFPIVARSVLSVTGLIAAAALGCTVCLGMYGYYLKKSLRSAWLHVHRAFALALLIAAVVHLFFSAPVAL